MQRFEKYFKYGIGPIIGLLLTLAVTGCQTMPERNDWLYQQLGGREGISKLETTFLLKVARDDRISGIFKDTDIVRLQRMLTEHTCMLAGGPCEYTGENMIEAHRGLHLTGADFNALTEDLILAMEDEGIPTGAQNRLLAQLAPSRRDVVGEHPLPPDEKSGLQAQDASRSARSEPMHDEPGANPG